MYNNECFQPRGKILGGSSSINFMIYNRGNRRDFDAWAQAGNYGWSYKDVLPYFLKSESANFNDFEDKTYHNASGLLSVEHVQLRTDIAQAFVAAAEQSGLNQTDYNGESQLGVAYVQTNTRYGRRHSAYRAFIEPIMFKRKNLKIFTFSRVTKVLMDANTKTAYGIEFLYRRQRFIFKARKEVILSAGAFSSPQILMLSGIGPADNLGNLGIKIIHQLPVGVRMFEHITHFGPTFIVNTTNQALFPSRVQLKDIVGFLAGRPDTRLSMLPGVEALAFLKVPNSTLPRDWPDVELIFASASLASDDGTALKLGGNFKHNVYNALYRPLQLTKQDHFTVLVMPFHPKSVGRVWLKNTNPLQWPMIDPNYFNSTEDVEFMLHGIKAAIRIAEMPAMKKVGTKILDTPVPGCESYTFGTDDYWRCSISTLSYTLHHQVATCRMGPATDSTAVVSPELRVHGIGKLRVVDAGIIPLPPTAHTNAPTFMIAEKAADMIKAAWRESLNNMQLKSLFQIFFIILYLLTNSNGQQNYIESLIQLGATNFIQELFHPQIPNNNEVFDFIVVGGGTAGSVVANRLSENPNWRVALLEAGGTENILNTAPALCGYMQVTNAIWNYKTVPQKRACFGMNNNECFHPRGKILGGTSSINFMIYNRGNRRDFDSWAEAGNYGWSYNEVLPYFRKSEMAHLEGLELNALYHNQSGPLSVEYLQYRTAIVHAFIEGAQQAGHQYTDYNGESQVGVSYVQANTRSGRRHSAYRAFIEPIMARRQNLKIFTFARVTKVLIDPETKAAYGVEFNYRKQRYIFKARKEVILSAGSFNSPQLLMLSGVGPRDNLSKLGINILQELPVGVRMYEHASHFGPTFLVNTTNQSIFANRVTIADVLGFLAGRPDTRISTLTGVEALAFIKVPGSKRSKQWPDCEIIFASGSLASDDGTALKIGGNIKDEIYNRVYRPLQLSRQDHFTVLIMPFHPKSVGRVWIRNKNPLQWPIIDANYFDDPDDVEVMLAGIKEAIRISQTPAMQSIGTRILDTPLPGCESYEFGSDDYWRCSIRTMTYTLHHQVATCRMGPSTDPTAVVSPELKVHGIRKLRVVDGGVIPFPPTAHTNAATYMIGEKAADMIRGAWGD
ncbi:uncharacterized protein ACRADG_008539 [Cochliomyia hominivorax]